MNKLKELREEINLTQKQLGERIGYSQRTISSWENDIAQPNIDNLKKLADFFEVTIDYLVEREDDFGNITLNTGDINGSNNTVNSHNVIKAGASRSSSDEQFLRKYHDAPEEIKKAIDKLLS